MPQTDQVDKSKVEKLEDLAIKVKLWGQSLGFQQVAIVKPDLRQASRYLNAWLEKGYQGSMAWMAEHGDKRYHVEKLIPHTVRVITVRMDYLADDKMIAVLKDNNKAYISRYALGRDYHKLIRKRLSTLVEKIKNEVPSMELSQRPFVDSAPVMEKPLAEQAGLGWIGKNSNLISKKNGSWLSLGFMILTKDLVPDKPHQSLCGKCDKCIENCPTKAIVEPFVVKSDLCIAYHTIENREKNIPKSIEKNLNGWVAGCDICQDVCPWNKFSIKHNEPLFNPKSEIFDYSKKQWKELTNEVFNSVFKNSPVNRTKFEGLKRNIEFVQ